MAGSIGASVGAFVPQFLSMGVMIGQLAIGAVFIIGVSYVIFHRLSFRDNVKLWKKTATGYLLIEDKGRIKKQKGQENYVFQRHKSIECDLPKYEHYITNGRSRLYLNGLLLDNNTVAWLTPDEIMAKVGTELKSNPSFIPMETDAKNMHVIRQRRIMEAFDLRDSIEKYAPYIVFIVGCIVIGVIMWAAVGQIEHLSNSVGNAAEPIDRGIQLLVQKCNPDVQHGVQGAF